MVIIDDILNRIKAKKTIGKQEYNNLKNYIETTFKDSQCESSNQGYQRVVEMAKAKKGMAEFYEILTSAGVSFAALSTYSMCTEEDVLQYLLAGGLSVALAVMGHLRGKEWKKSYKNMREIHKEYILDDASDDAKSRKRVRNVNEIDQEQRTTFDGKKYSPFVLDTVLSDIADELIK